MSRGPKPGVATRVDFVAKARKTWNDGAPEWVLTLAAEATRTSATLAAKKIGYSTAVLSHVFANNYSGDLARVEEKVRGALMNATVKCPILGEIGRHQCLDEQKKPFAVTSSIRSKLFRACRSGCPHSRITKESA